MFLQKNKLNQLNITIGNSKMRAIMYDVMLELCGIVLAIRVYVERYYLRYNLAWDNCRVK